MIGVYSVAELRSKEYLRGNDNDFLPSIGLRFNCPVMAVSHLGREFVLPQTLRNLINDYPEQAVFPIT